MRSPIGGHLAAELLQLRPLLRGERLEGAGPRQVLAQLLFRRHPDDGSGDVRQAQGVAQRHRHVLLRHVASAAALAAVHLHRHQADLLLRGQRPHLRLEVVGMAIDEVDGVHDHVYVMVAQRLHEAHRPAVAAEAHEAGEPLLARLQQRPQRAVRPQGLLRVHGIVAEAVDVDQVGMIGLQLLQVPLQQLASRVAIRCKGLGDEKHFLAPVLQHLTELELRPPVTGEVRRRVHIVDALVDRLVEQRDRVLILGLRPHRRRPHRQDRHPDARLPEHAPRQRLLRVLRCLHRGQPRHQRPTDRPPEEIPAR